MTLEQFLEQAIAHHQAQRLAEAEKLYRQVLAANPRHPTALHLLGVLAGQAGSPGVAIEMIARAIAIHPTEAMYHINLGIFLGAAGRHGESLAAFRHAIRLKPESPDAHLHLAVGHIAQNQPADAQAALCEAIRLRPEFPEAWLNLGNAQQALRQDQAALESYRHALSLRPAYADAVCNIGSVQRRLGDAAAAEAAYREALVMDPDHAQAHHLMGAVCLARGALAEAQEYCERAVGLDPRLADAHCNLGIVLRLTGNLAAAEREYRAAIRLRPHFAEAFNNLGVVLQMQGRVDDAVIEFRHALSLQPGAGDVLLNLGSAYQDQADLDGAIRCYRGTLAASPDLADAHSNVLFVMMFHPGYTQQDIFDEARQWAARFEMPLKPLIRPHQNERHPDRPLRVGYVSPDFRNHVQSLFTLPLFTHHDRAAVHIIGYSGAAAPDDLTRQIESHCDVWRATAGLGDSDLADLVARDQIDILVDLTMHMAGSRLKMFARKPAPVQVAWLAYPGTTGLDGIDYRFTDPQLDPSGAGPGTLEKIPVYSEMSYRLPETFWCFDPSASADAVPITPLPADGSGVITFGCLNNFCKINGATLSLWARVLRAMPAARLLMLAPEGAARKRVQDHLLLEGIASSRLEFVARTTRARYLATFARIDIGLDTLPANGHTTSLDSYFMGVPVITQVGSTISGRAGLSQLTNLSLAELAAGTPDDFVTTTVALANDHPRLRALRNTLRDRLRASPLMNASRFARHVETAYRTLWRCWCEGAAK